MMGKEIPVKARGEGGNGVFIKTALKVFIALLVIGQMLLLSAFEAHIVNVTAKICAPSEVRTMGYWKNHLDDFSWCLPVTVGGESVDKTRAEEIFSVANPTEPHDPMDMLRAQTLAMTLNVECGGIETTNGEPYEGLTLGEILTIANNILAGTSDEDPEHYKDLLDDLNNGLYVVNDYHYIRYCSSPPSEFIGYDIPQGPDKDKKPKDKSTDLASSPPDNPGRGGRTNNGDSMVLGQATTEDLSLDNSSSSDETISDPPPQEPEGEQPSGEEGEEEGETEEETEEAEGEEENQEEGQDQGGDEGETEEDSENNIMEVETGNASPSPKSL